VSTVVIVGGSVMTVVVVLVLSVLLVGWLEARHEAGAGDTFRPAESPVVGAGPRHLRRRHAWTAGRAPRHLRR
jgi:hypothetical protein